MNSRHHPFYKCQSLRKHSSVCWRDHTTSTARSDVDGMLAVHQAALVGLPNLSKGSCLQQMLNIHLQWGKPLASEQNTFICSLEHPFLWIWGPAQQPLWSAWIPAQGRRNSLRLCHPDYNETWKGICLTSLLQTALLSLPSHPLIFSSWCLLLSELILHLYFF